MSIALLRQTLHHSLHTMSFARPYSYISDSSLAELWRSRPKDVKVVDVRDDDFEGGNLVGALHVPSTRFNDEVQGLVTGPLRDARQVIFHCSLSQSRGPKAARIYRETRDEAIATGKIKPLGSGQQDEQQVQVLRDGFAGFGPKYKNDASLVEKWDEDSWKYR